MVSPQPVPYEQSLFAALDVGTMQDIFDAVPVDTRLRCREVCCAWRDLLDISVAVWRVIDVSPYSGVAPRNLSVALLRAAAAQTDNGLEALNVSDCGALVYDPESACFNPEFLSFLSELRDLRHLVWSDDVVPEVEVLTKLFDAAMVAEKICVNVFVKSFEQACSMLRLEPPFQSLCPHYFCVELSELQDCDWPVFASLLPNFRALDRLNISHVLLIEPEDLDAIVDAVIDIGISCLLLEGTALEPTTAAPAISRLLRLGSVQILKVRQCPFIRPLFDEASFAAELASALRNDEKLLSLTLGGIGLWNDVATGNSILAALSNHPSLRNLELCCNKAKPHQADEILRALIALVANSPNLRELNIRGVFVDADGDASAFLSEFHEAALAINPNIRLPSLEPLYRASEPDESDSEPDESASEQE